MESQLINGCYRDIFVEPKGNQWYITGQGEQAFIHKVAEKESPSHKFKPPTGKVDIAPKGEKPSLRE